MSSRGNTFVLGIPTAIAVWFVLVFALGYLTGDPSQAGIYAPRYRWLVAHALGGAVPLLAGPAQFWLALNRRYKTLHVVLGVLYVAGVAVSGTAAFYLAIHTDFGWVFGLSFASMASAWFLTTALAVVAIYMRRAEHHREWMIRSYVVTFGFVTFRTLDFFLDLAKAGTIVERMTAASWLSWTVPLLITEIILQGRKIFAGPSRAESSATPVIAPLVAEWQKKPLPDFLSAGNDRLRR